MTTTRRDVLSAGLAAASAAVTSSVVRAQGHDHDHQDVPSDPALRFELIPPAEYLRMSYYEKWLAALPQILIKTGMASAAEIESGNAIGGTNTKWHVLTVAEVATWDVPEPATTEKITAHTQLRVGQRVRARNLSPVGHTRLPRYVRGKLGMITRDGGIEELQDTDIQGLGPKQQHVYTVRFPARELWGNQASPRDSVYADLWEGYLEPA